MKILSRCPAMDKHSHVQTGSCTSDLLALVGFCDFVWVLISHRATLQTGLFCLLVPVSQGKEPQTQITKPYQKYNLSPPGSFFKAAGNEGDQQQPPRWSQSLVWRWEVKLCSLGADR